MRFERADARLCTCSSAAGFARTLASPRCKMVQSPPSFGTAAELLAGRRRVTSFPHIARAQRRGASRGSGDKNAERHLGQELRPRDQNSRP